MTLPLWSWDDKAVSQYLVSYVGDLNSGAYACAARILLTKAVSPAPDKLFTRLLSCRNGQY